MPKQRFKLVYDQANNSFRAHLSNGLCYIGTNVIEFLYQEARTFILSFRRLSGFTSPHLELVGMPVLIKRLSKAQSTIWLHFYRPRFSVAI